MVVLQENNQTLSECKTENQTNPKVRSKISEQNGHGACEKPMKKKRKRQMEENQPNTEEETKKKHKKRKQEEFDGNNIFRISHIVSL